MYKQYLEYYNRELFVNSEEEGFCKKEVLQSALCQVKQNNLHYLASIKDRRFIKNEFGRLKKGLYPYPFRKEQLKNRFNIKNLLLFLMPIEPFFWMLHLLYKFKFDS